MRFRWFAVAIRELMRDYHVGTVDEGTRVRLYADRGFSRAMLRSAWSIFGWQWFTVVLAALMVVIAIFGPFPIWR